MEYTLITGSTGGLGRAYARECARRGFNLFLTGTSEEKLSKFKEELSKLFPGVLIEYKACNLADENARMDFFKEVNNKGCSINRLVLNAGIDYEGPILEKKPEEIQKVIKINCEATIHLFHLFLNQRNLNSKFYVLIVSSLAGYYAMPQKAIYSSSKAMLTNSFTAMHEELKCENVNISIVCPGGMPTTQEMINSIKSQGLSGRLSSTPMEKVAIKSLNALNKNKLIVIPGWFNRFLKNISFPFSKQFVARQINKRWQKTRKKAKKLGN